MSNIKNDTTLFRFVSLRSPELAKENDMPIRFVLHPDNTSGPYFTAMAARTIGQSKWSVLKKAAITFSALENEDQIKGIVGISFYQTAGWLSQNRTTSDINELLQKISSIQPLNMQHELMLWDNLFFQIVAQKSFYIKEIVMQLLVLNNLIKQIINREDKLNLLSQLIAARVVLPIVLFDEERKLTGEIASSGISSTSETRAKNIIIAKEDMVILQAAKNEILQLEKKFNATYEKKYRTAVLNHEKAVRPLIEDYNRRWNEAKRDLCKESKPENYNPSDYCSEPNLQFPELPSFEFNLSQLVDEKFFGNALSKAVFEKLKKIGAFKDVESYFEILENVDNEIKRTEIVITDNTDFSTPVLLIGGTVISANNDFKPPFTPVPTPTPTPIPVPKKFGVKQLGIADYKKVVAHVCCYDAGEVSHIENIMSGEMRSRTTGRERTEEFTVTTSTEQESESLTDNTTTERFEMQKEIAEILKQEKKFTAEAKFHAGWGIGENKFSLDLNAGYASTTSKEESNKQAVTQAKELTQRAMERIVTKFRTETIRRTTESFKEQNVHEFDNRGSAHHVSGVYRFINAIYKNQVYNYGKRLMYEFMIPEPAKMHRFGMTQSTPTSSSPTILQKPIDPRLNGLATAAQINEFNYTSWAAAYGASAKPLPAHEVFVGKSFVYYSNTAPTANTQSGDVQIPEGYMSSVAQINFTGMGALTGWDAKVIASVGNQAWVSVPGRVDLTGFFPVRAFKSSIPIAMSVTSFVTCTVTINVGCILTQEFIASWQQGVFDAIIQAYEDKLAEYNNAVSQSQTNIDTNPGFYRQTEQAVLRKNCIAYLIDQNLMGVGFYSGSTLMDFSIQQSQALEDYASLVKFMEQAFEWELMSYNFYPYYWGKRSDWTELYQYDCNDPLFRSFMQAGMARVIVTIKPGFEDAVMYYMATGQIWNGGQTPILGDPLYLSIVDELKEQEYVVEETWETVVPTSLVALQSSGVAINAEGLPCGDGCEDHAGSGLVKNGEVLGVR